MKRLLALLAAAMICIFGTVSAVAAEQSVSDTNLSSVEEELPDGMVDEKDYVIDINLTTTLIVSISAVLILGIGTVTVILARRNRS